MTPHCFNLFCLHYLLLLSWSLINSSLHAAAWINYPSDGTATMTHYTLPRDYIASCGCTASSTHYPTAALSQMAYGSSTSFGPACGRCFNLTLISPVIATPPFNPPPKSLVVKITDLCPLSTTGWCSATESTPNSAGQFLNFDLAFPSDAIPDDFFPSDEALYGYKDFGVWNINYQTVPCLADWAGARDAAALGSVPDMPEGVCCPSNPTGNANDTCPSYSDKNGIPPDTTTSSAHLSTSFSYWIIFIPIICSRLLQIK